MRTGGKLMNISPKVDVAPKMIFLLSDWSSAKFYDDSGPDLVQVKAPGS